MHGTDHQVALGLSVRLSKQYHPVKELVHSSLFFHVDGYNLSSFFFSLYRIINDFVSCVTITAIDKCLSVSEEF